MKLLFAILAALVLSSCARLPGLQTVGLQSDPDQATKYVLVSAGLVVDAVGVYGALPPCAKGVKQPLGCRSEKAYRDAKLIAQSVGAGFEGLRTGSRSSLLLSAGLLYAQYELAKTLADTPGPTSPEAPPAPQAAAYLDAIGLADVLVNSADQRVKDAGSVNTTVVELLDSLQQKVAALP